VSLYQTSWTRGDNTWDPPRAGRGRRGLLGTLLKRYLKPGGSGIFLVDIYCYDPPEWCGPALATLRAVGLHLSMRAAQPLVVTSADPWAAGAQPARGGQGADIQGQGDWGAHRVGRTLAASMRRPTCTWMRALPPAPDRRAEATAEQRPRRCLARAVLRAALAAAQLGGRRARRERLSRARARSFSRRSPWRP